jgi:hypothetical protein
VSDDKIVNSPSLAQASDCYIFLDASRQPSRKQERRRVSCPAACDVRSSRCFLPALTMDLEPHNRVAIALRIGELVRPEPFDFQRVRG